MQQCPLLREKRTRAGRLLTSGNDPGCVKKSADIYEKNPKAEGLILLKHGIFTFGADAREAYERTIEMVSLAEARIARGRKTVFVPTQLPHHSR